MQTFKTVEEMEKELHVYAEGPGVQTTNELLMRYKALRAAFIAETDGKDPDDAEKKFMKEGKKD